MDTYNRKKGKEEYDNGSRIYFESIKKLPTLYIEAKAVSNPYISSDIRNIIVLLIYESYHLDKWVKLNIVSSNETKEKTTRDYASTLLNLKTKSSIAFQNSPKFQTFTKEAEHDDAYETGHANILKEPRVHPSVTVEDKNMVICGLSAVLRFMFKYVCYKIEEAGSDKDKNTLLILKQLLGFRGGCLQACAESSIWTKFCEVDMISSVNEIVKLTEIIESSVKNNGVTELKVPNDLIRFENHLSLPVKIHNIQRVIQDGKKANKSSDKLMDTLNQEFDKSVSITDLKHEFAEGPTLLLSDLILFPSFLTYVQLLGHATFRRLFPRTFDWQDKVSSLFPISIDIENDNSIFHNVENKWFISDDVPVQSLYLRDTNRYKPSLRLFTRQYEVEEALAYLKEKDISSLDQHLEAPAFQWNDIPMLAHPEGGSLPQSRMQRKCDQLASMVHHALHVHSLKTGQYNTHRRFRIVDFCSGGGHLGILLAHLLPDCEVVLVENKDESLRRAQERISGLGLRNVLCYQSNLDYFDSSFDLGVALHACGTATDLVISKCVKANASIVCCPCCYGAVQENHILTYPRSTIFQSVSLRHYLVLCHASDQTEAKEKPTQVQGRQCMTIVDTDRCLYAADNRYNVKLCQIVPGTASSKNHIIVAVSSDL